MPAVEEVKDLVKKSLIETKDREETVEGLPMMKIGGDPLPDDIAVLLDLEDLRAANGALILKESIKLESRICNGGALQKEADRFRDMASDFHERVKTESDLTIVRDLAQKGVAHEEVARLIEQERIKEEALWLEEGDVTRLERLKRWLKKIGSELPR